MKRKRFSEREILFTLIHSGYKLVCFRCKETFLLGDLIEREHLHEIELGGPDTPENCRFSHKACHALVTNGNGATSAGSSKQRIAKVKRIQKKEAGEWVMRKKIPSRPFSKRIKP